MGSLSLIPQSGIISSSLQFLLDRFTVFSQREPSIVLGVEDELKKLQRTVLKVQAFFDSISNQIQWSYASMALKLWLRHLQDVLDDADDLLLEIGLELSKLTSTDSEQVRALILSRFRNGFPFQVIDMQRKLEELVKEMDGMFVNEILLKATQPIERYRRLPTSSLVDESCVVGRGNDKLEVMKMLLSDRESTSVVAIVGMAGVGKTTLAQLVYNDQHVVNEFDLRIWVSISAEDSVERISSSIIESANGKMMKLSDLNSIQIKLEKFLERKKVLIVLDGMWDENTSHWDILRLPFRGTAKGSKILVTTQSMRVSNIVTTPPPYQLHTLLDEDCWSLIKKRAFSSMEHGDYDDLVEIGMNIAKKCQGLPLAARIIGSVLHCKSDKSEWDAILNSKILELTEIGSELLPEFTLGYHLLPHCLKRCFAYCSVFPQNFEFTRDGLVQLWVAEGFVQPQPRKRIDDIGRGYFDILLQRSFFQFSRFDYNNQPVFKMHNLMYELAQFVSGELSFRMDDNFDMSQLWPNFTNARHASFISGGYNHRQSLELFCKCNRLRTLLLFPSDDHFQDIVHIPYDLFLSLHCMRVLNLSRTNIVELPDSIGALKHLHYLDVSYTNIEKLPESVTNLHGLDTLKLINCFNLLQLPNHMKNLINLRHLELDIKHQIRFMPPNLGNLTNLQTLSAFIVGKEEGQGIKELQNMNYLHGSLCITNLENVSSTSEASMAKLCGKRYIDKLELQWNESDGNSAKGVFSGLQPHCNIKELTLTGYGSSLFPYWLNHTTFNDLVSISLQNCHDLHLPQFSSLPALRSMYIDGMRNLKVLKISHGFLPLKSLTLKDMQNLQQFDLTGGVMPELRQLTIVDCQNLHSLPQLHHLSCLKNLEIMCCPKLQSLPSGGLPSSLKSLIIVECNILKEKCRENYDRLRIIQRVEIDYELTPRVVAN